MRLAERLIRLGTETAFAVSAEANAFASEGNKVYPFHLGDINLKTPQNIIDAAMRAANAGKTGYCPNAGIPELREALAEDINRARGTSYSPENVVIQPGGKPTISKTILAMVNPGEEILYPNPGFPIYESQIEYTGARAVPYAFREGSENFELNLEEIRNSITSRTRMLIYNDLQNPTAAESSETEMGQIAEMANENDLVVLSDEAYFDIRFEGRSRSIVSFPGMAERTVILYTFSKKYAMTGWRLGGAIGPKKVMEAVATMNVNEESCTNHFVQWAGVEALTGDQSGSREIIGILKERRDAAVEILRSIKGVKCFVPHASFYLYPNLTEAMERKGLDYEELRTQALEKTGVSFCTRQHFGRILPGETQKYVRLAYSGIDSSDIEEGLTRFKKFLES
jgi:aspartate/methionine/tyrosine aminotransferase